jgi:hypothetical protein
VLKSVVPVKMVSTKISPCTCLTTKNIVAKNVGLYFNCFKDNISLTFHVIATLSDLFV